MFILWIVLTAICVFTCIGAICIFYLWIKEFLNDRDLSSFVVAMMTVVLVLVSFVMLAYPIGGLLKELNIQ